MLLGVGNMMSIKYLMTLIDAYYLIFLQLPWILDLYVGGASSGREEFNQFITSVNSFHPALKYTWEISKNLFAFLDIKLSINNSSLSNNVQYKPTDSHNYLPHSSSHPQHIKNAIPFSQFL